MFLTVTLVLTWFNYLFLKLPPTIGVMVNALLLSIFIQVVSALGYPEMKDWAVQFLVNIDFSDILMNWFLPVLLFAGALHANLSDLKDHKWSVGLLATFGIVVSTFAVGYLTHYALFMFGWDVSIVYCIAFGALISPTDPIAVMGIMKTAGTPKPLRNIVVFESLANDGTSIVVFTILLGIITLGHEPSVFDISSLFVHEAIGGVVFGALLGLLGFAMLRTVDQHEVSVMITLVIVLGGSAVAAKLHVSSPLAMVVAGLIIGNYGKIHAMSENSSRFVTGFWQLVDDLANSALFVLIGCELLVLSFSWLHVVAGTVLGIVVLTARFITLAPPIGLLRTKVFGSRKVERGAIRILTWGGMRGGISVALALSLPAGAERDLLLVLTYIVVLMSILIQGLTLGKMVKMLYGEKKRKLTAHQIALSEAQALAEAEQLEADIESGAITQA
jgi:CPA1 family monovalent cation:H+ antiporter